MIKIDCSIGKINFKFQVRLHLNLEIVNELLNKKYKPYDQRFKLTFIPIKKPT